MYKVPSISRSNQWFRTVCGLDHGMHNSTQYRAASHAMYLWQLTPRSLLPQSPHLGTEPLFLVYKYTRRPPGVFELWYGINVCIGISSGGTTQIKRNYYTRTNIRIMWYKHSQHCAQVHTPPRYHTSPNPNPYPIPKSTRKNGTRILFTCPTLPFIL